MVLKQCGKRYINITGKLVFFATLFILMVQLTYLHTYKTEKNRADLTRLLSVNPEDKDKRKPISAGSNELEVDPRENIPPLRFFPDMFFKPPHQPLIYGKPRQKKGYLTIAIPSVHRPNTERIYLYDTLDSIFEKMPETEHPQITIVVMVSDTNKTYNNQVSAQVYSRYKAFCDIGTIHVIQTSDCIYPDLNNVRKTFNDSQTRIKWRAKQNIDFAFLMLYSRNLSDYYIQLEDDVVVATDFIQEIRDFISALQKDWFLLEFSRLGFIGKLFKSSDLKFLSSFLLKNYDLAPCDLLLGSMRVEKGQKKPIHSNYSLFQHIGRFSSLKNKLMPSIDNKFKDNIGIDLLIDLPKGDNPPATVNTSMEAYEDNLPEHAYDSDNTTFFWAKTPKKRDHFTLLFEKPYNFSRIIIMTGVLETRKDSFRSSVLVYSESRDFGVLTNNTSCGNKFKKLADLVDGDIDTKATGTTIPDNINCLRIYATKAAKNWVVFRDIQLFLKHEV